MAKTMNIRSITAIDIKRRHPRYLTCQTDYQYGQLANEIFNLLEIGLSNKNDQQRRDISISMALYMEDLQSETHLFETFTRIYQKMFGTYLPFYSSAGSNDEKAEEDAMCFMLWLSICAESEGTISNPTNNGLRKMARDLVLLWHERRINIPPNEELADLLYSEETQRDVNMVKTVLIWLGRYCPLGRWYTNLPPDDNIRHLFKDAEEDLIEYANDCYSLAEQRVWPLSLTPQQIYAEMIRIDMDDPDDELAAAIEKLEYKPFGIYKLEGSDSKYIRLSDFKGDIINVSRGNFLDNTKKMEKRNTHLAGSFINMNGQWHLNGAVIWSAPPAGTYEKYVAEQKQNDLAMNGCKGQYDDYIRQHGGERLFFFKNFSSYKKWLHKDFGLKQQELEELDCHQDAPLVVFFEDNGQMTISLEPECIKHPSNPFYNQSEAEATGLHYIVAQHICSPGLLLYLIEHDLLPDVLINDMRGYEHGHLVVQDNIEFLTRCMRRDILTDKVFRKRIIREEDNTEENIFDRYISKLPYNEFVETIAKEKTIRSKALKEWRVVSANKTTTVIRDVRNRLDYKIPTRKLYEAHLNLGKDEIQISSVAPFVGKDNASAASALLYNVVGRGKFSNEFSKFAQALMRSLRKK